MKKGAVVIFESTVYPGLRKSMCPHTQRGIGSYLDEGFSRGIFPGADQSGGQGAHLDQDHEGGLRGRSRNAGRRGRLYESIVTAGVHRTGSIKEAEAAKVIENIQRDINIALINELSMIFNKLEDRYDKCVGGCRVQVEFFEI